METLSSKQKKYLKSQAQTLKSLVIIGKGGVNSQTIKNIRTALDQHELIKVKFNAFKEEKESYVEPILNGSDSQFVSMIGHVLTLYREQEDKEKQKYSVPG